MPGASNDRIRDIFLPRRVQRATTVNERIKIILPEERRICLEYICAFYVLIWLIIRLNDIIVNIPLSYLNDSLRLIIDC